MRTKLVIALVVCTSLAAAAVGVLSYRATADRLEAEIDVSLEQALRSARRELDARRPGGAGRPLVSPREIDLQLVAPDGRTVSSPGTVGIPVDDADLRLAGTDQPGLQRFRDTELDDVPVRVLTESLGGARGAAQAVRSLEEVRSVLSGLRTRILWVSVVVAAVAGLVGWVIARQVTRRLARVTETAEEVAATGSLDVEVPVEGTDESARLGVAFNGMLAALAGSKADQQRLVEDAGHELRTPMTSLRANLYALRRFDQLDAAAREDVLDDLDSETEELSRLIDEVVEVATDRRGDEPLVEVDLATLACRVAPRAADRWDREVEVRHDGDVEVLARPEALGRVFRNLVENACKFDGSGFPVEVRVAATAAVGDTPAGATAEVLDRGPGIDDADLGHVFERFYRSPDARSRPGSGLGLSIVAEVVAAHGGAVRVRNRDGGGAAVGFWIPSAPPDEASGGAAGP